VDPTSPHISSSLSDDGCASCHSVHRSSSTPLLSNLYRVDPLRSATEPYDGADFGLCLTCHQESPYADVSGSSNPLTGFAGHGFHLGHIEENGLGGVEITVPGDGQGNALCAECHYNLHGVPTSERGLVRFAPDVLPFNGEITFDAAAGSCTLTCHAKQHDALTFEALQLVSVDSVAPTTTAPSATLRSGASLSGSSVPLSLTWSGSDNAGGSGIDHYELARTTDGGATWPTVSSSLTTRSAAVSAAASGTVRYRVRAVDKAGNPGAWAYGPTLSPRRVQQSSTAVKYGGTWTTVKSSSYSGGSTRYARVTGRWAAYKFTGRSIALVTTKSPSRGKVKIFINGVRVATVDLYRSSSQYRVLAWQRTWSTSGTRTIKVVVVGTSGRPRVDLDAFVVVVATPRRRRPAGYLWLVAGRSDAPVAISSAGIANHLPAAGHRGWSQACRPAPLVYRSIRAPCVSPPKPCRVPAEMCPGGWAQGRSPRTIRSGVTPRSPAARIEGSTMNRQPMRDRGRARPSGGRA
jgi:hypothetical protein